MPLATALGLYAQAAVPGGCVLALDIVFLLLAVVAGQPAGHWVTVALPAGPGMQCAGGAALVLMVVLQGTATLRPPRMGLLRDPLRDCCGIPEEP
jgi:hypothetical protein